MFLNFTRHWLSLALLASLGLAGCAEKEDVSPEPEPCGTVVATVQLCLGKTALCPTEHTTLRLADGTLLRPTGDAWEQYELNQVQGQVVRIGYTPSSEIPKDGMGDKYAAVTCLEPVYYGWCGTPDINNRQQKSWRAKLKR